VGGDGSLKIIQQLATLSNSLLVGIPNTINIVMM
jgi:6-phosphofructokinase